MKFDEKWVNDVYSLFDKFYNETREFREKCQDNEKFWRAQHWAGVRKEETGEPQPVTPVIFSTLENMLADIMDSYPKATILGQEEQDDKIAKVVGDYVNYVLKRRNYKSVYRDKCREMLKKGMSIQEVFWDKSLYYGLGDVNVKNISIENFLWDDSVCDIQDSRALFKYYFYPKRWFEERFGKEAVLKFKNDSYSSGIKSDEPYYMLVEYWYKTYDRRLKKECVHMARLAGHTLVYASEKNMPRGIYEHGKYPFIIDTLYPISGKITGLSVIDIFKNLQIYADKLDQIIVKNALLSGKMKMLINRNAEIDEGALLDWSCEVVRGNRIDEQSVRWFQPNQLNPAVMAHYNSKLNSIKEESGQNMFNRGEVGKGITAASAIMALQEAGSKRSRLIIDSLYDGFERMVKMLILVICENYTENRYFRIDGKRESIGRDSLIKTVYQNGASFLEFDVSINVEKQTPYKTLYQNELALQLLSTGILVPKEALSMMSFDGKDALLSKVEQRIEIDSERAENIEQ